MDFCACLQVLTRRRQDNLGKTCHSEFTDSGSTENWISFKNAKNLGVDLKPTNETSACMADGSVLKTIAMFDCEVDFKNGKEIQVFCFYVLVKGNDIIIGRRVLKNNSDLFEIHSDSGTSIESSFTIDN
uniref:Uncharacterized protein n=1 Tax=Strongyloides venezuelensis TaxID=75913 RepID=A0A0K0FJ54_STRVS